jgi:TetR/AcrR family transcriptional regulator, transcriptional repressor for nem operon
MPWPKQHKEKTRSAIVQAAATLLRAQGVEKAGIAEIMARAGRTHGGFYAHFGSKDELLASALDWADRETYEMLSSAMASVPPDRRIHAVIDAYLSAPHLAHPERGCPVAAVGSDVTRSGGRVRRELERAIARRYAWLRGLAPRRGRARDDAIGMLSCMVGAMVLARGAEARQSKAILAASRRFLHRALDS